MATKKRVNHSIRFTEKNLYYLQELHMIDARNGKKKNNATNLNEFVNQCVTLVCESNKNPKNSICSNAELKIGWKKQRISIINKQIDDLQKQAEHLRDETK